jgi:hypothetical protein
MVIRLRQLSRMQVCDERTPEPRAELFKCNPSYNVIRIQPMICNAKDLSPDQKAVLEALLGHRVQDDDAVSVRTFETAMVPHQRKLEIADELRKYFAEVDASRQPVSEEAAEDIITEAMRSVRPGYRPHQ